MKKTELKKLAEMTITDNEINETVKNYVCNKLTKSELKIYLYYLKRELEKNKLYVQISDLPDKKTEKEITEIFKNKKIVYELNPELGAGLQIREKDDVINLNIKNIIEKTIKNLKENI